MEKYINMNILSRKISVKEYLLRKNYEMNIKYSHKTVDKYYRMLNTINRCRQKSDLKKLKVKV